MSTVESVRKVKKLEGGFVVGSWWLNFEVNDILLM